MKKIFPFFFAFLLALNSFGLLFFYGGGILICKIYAKEKIISDSENSNRKLIQFSSARKNLIVIDEDEIMVDDYLFDIVKTEKQGDQKIYFVLIDEQEGNFLNELSEFEKNNSNSSSLPTKNPDPEILKYIKHKKIFDPDSIISNLRFTNLNSFGDSFFYQSPYENIFSPPPKSFTIC